MSQHRWGEVGDLGVVEVGEPFGARKLGLIHQPDAAAGLSFVAFSGQHLGQDALWERRCLAAAAASCPAWGADGGQLQGFRCGSDGSLSGRIG